MVVVQNAVYEGVVGGGSCHLSHLPHLALSTTRHFVNRLRLHDVAFILQNTTNCFAKVESVASSFQSNRDLAARLFFSWNLVSKAICVHRMPIYRMNSKLYETVQKRICIADKKSAKNSQRARLMEYKWGVQDSPMFTLPCFDSPNTKNIQLEMKEKPKKIRLLYWYVQLGANVKVYAILTSHILRLLYGAKCTWSAYMKCTFSRLSGNVK